MAPCERRRINHCRPYTANFVYGRACSGESVIGSREEQREKSRRGGKWLWIQG